MKDKTLLAVSLDFQAFSFLSGGGGEVGRELHSTPTPRFYSSLVGRQIGTDYSWSTCLPLWRYGGGAMLVVYWWDEFMVRCLSNGVRETDQRNDSREKGGGGGWGGGVSGKEGEVEILKGWEVGEIEGKYATMLKGWREESK